MKENSDRNLPEVFTNRGFTVHSTKKNFLELKFCFNKKTNVFLLFVVGFIVVFQFDN